MYIIHRNQQMFGPYSIDIIKHYVEDGKILLQDKISRENDNYITTVSAVLNQHHIKIRIKNEGSILEQIKSVGKELVSPNIQFIKNDLLKDQKVLTLAFIGLAPAFLITFTMESYLTFYAIALYFSLIWGAFFYFIFKTPQVDQRKAVAIFFIAQGAALVLSSLQLIPPMSYLYALTKSTSIIGQFIGFTLGVGVTEEFIKLLPLLYVIRTAKEPLVPQTLVYYGLVSGIGFGVLEGVFYQTTTNTSLEYNVAFFMNIARLTCLPFLHAIWSSIAGYFIAFANLFPKFRQSLYAIALSLPALLHGIYDTLGWNILGLASTFISVLLLTYYLKKSSDYQNKLINLK